MKIILLMLGIIGMTILFQMLYLVWYSKQIDNIKQNHESFDEIYKNDIEIFDGEVYVKYLDRFEYREFKKNKKRGKI